LRFVHGLARKRVVLGNHDFSILVQAQRFPGNKLQASTLEVLQADDGEELIDGLRQFPLLYADTRLQTVMSHAGLFPQWSLEQGQAASDAVSAQLPWRRLPRFPARNFWQSAKPVVARVARHGLLALRRQCVLPDALPQ